MDTEISNELAKEYVPGSTIARVFKEMAFKKETTEITEPTVILCGEYVRLFIQEAILRSNEQRLAELDEQMSQDVQKQESLREQNIDEETISEANDDFGDGEEDEEDMESRGLGVCTQIEVDLPPLDALETRHLTAISGLLLMDF